MSLFLILIKLMGFCVNWNIFMVSEWGGQHQVVRSKHASALKDFPEISLRVGLGCVSPYR